MKKIGGSRNQKIKNLKFLLKNQQITKSFAGRTLFFVLCASFSFFFLSSFDRFSLCCSIFLFFYFFLFHFSLFFLFSSFFEIIQEHVTISKFSFGVKLEFVNLETGPFWSKSRRHKEKEGEGREGEEGLGWGWGLGFGVWGLGGWWWWWCGRGADEMCLSMSHHDAATSELATASTHK